MCAPLSRRHHFLPVFYLRQWCDDASAPPGGSPGLWRFDRDGSNPRRLSPQNRAFWIEHGNTLTSTNGTRTDLPERILGRIESEVARTLRERIEPLAPLGPDEADGIDMFFSSLLVRVPSARASLQAGIDAMARIQRETAEAEGRPVPETTLFQENAMAHAAIASLDAIHRELRQMTHRVLLAPAGTFFVTSDRPAQVWAPSGPAAVANILCEATLPLTPTRLLHLTWGGLEHSGYCNMAEEDVLGFNQRIIAHSSAWFISRTRTPDPRWFADENT